jgi:hypothetical protein
MSEVKIHRKRLKDFSKVSPRNAVKKIEQQQKEIHHGCKD